MTKENERSLVRFATPYLEVGAQSIPSPERTIVLQELEQARLAPKRNDGDQPS